MEGEQRAQQVGDHDEGHVGERLLPSNETKMNLFANLSSIQISINGF
jgi:hypothetical protein